VTLFAFYGTFTSTQPGHANLRDARFVAATRTAPRYRLFIVDGAWPALVQAADGAAIDCEVYDAGEELLAQLAELEPPGWNRAPLELGDGRIVEAFVADPALAERGEDVSSHGGWPAFREWLAASRRRHLPDEVKTERLLLRQWRDDDVQPLAEIYAQAEYRAFMRGHTLEETREQIERFRRRWAEDGVAHWAAEERATGRLVGRIGLLRHHDWPLEPSPVEVGWTLHRDWTGRGLATEGGRASVEIWRELLSQDPRILSITTPMNVRSRAVMDRLGFTERGTTFWHDLDVVWYALERD
jgi:ribosomal-protein-alanine N-acetyltransferase